MNAKRLYDLINMASAEGILHETETVLQMAYPGMDADRLYRFFMIPCACMPETIPVTRHAAPATMIFSTAPKHCWP